MEKRILIAIDGSPASQNAVSEGLEIAEAMQSGVTFVHASSRLVSQLEHASAGGLSTAEQILALDPVLEEAVARAEELGVQAEPAIISEASSSADLAAEIAGMAAGLDARMIVVGSRGRGSVAGTVLGSVSHNLIKWATLPVLVVHAAKPAE